MLGFASPPGASAAKSPRNTLGVRQVMQTPLMQRKLDLLRALLAQDADSLVWILDHLAQKRNDVRVSVHKARRERNGIRDPGEGTSMGVPVLASFLRQSSNELPTIQFSSYEFHVRDEEKIVELEIVRIGNKAGRSDVTLVTKDQTAKAGQHYVAIEDNIVFEPGVGSIIHQVELFGGTHWEALLDFEVELKSDTAFGAKVGRQMDSCRVKIVCQDTFPNADLEKDLEDDPEVELHHTRLKFYFASLRMLWSHPDIRRGTIKRCLVDQLHNINFLVQQFITVFSVNLVFRDRADGETPSKDERTDWLYGLIAIQVLCLGVLHIVDYKRFAWPVGGPSRKLIQKALLRRFMYYDSSARRSTNPSNLVMAISRDAVGLVSGYSAAMKIAQALGGLLAVFVFKILSHLIFGKKLLEIRWIGFLPFFAFPVLLAVFVHHRSGFTTDCLEKKQEATNDMVTYCHRAVERFQLVRDYKRRQRFVDGLDKPVGAWNNANRAYNKANMVNQYFPQWLVLVFICSWYWFYGREVIWGTLSLGFFLADIKIIEKFGDEFKQLYNLYMTIEFTFPNLCRVAVLLNKPTDLEDRMINEKNVLSRTRSLRKQLAGAGEGALDRVPIFTHDLQFRLGSSIMFDFRGRVEIAQGTTVCFVGAHGAGKTTLLSVLGNALFPHIVAGEVFVPAHIRSLHVCLEPCFFEGTLMENMCFGVEVSSDGHKDRVRAILRALQCEDCVDGGVDSTERKMWQSQLTVQQQHTLNLARALIANPHLLCLHKPTMAYGAKNSEMVMQVLQTCVRNRGLEQGTAPVESRRPRTVIYTTFRKRSTEYADKIFKIAKTGVSEIKREEVVDEMF